MANLIWDPVNNVWKGTFTIANDGTGNSNETYTIDLGDMVGPVTVTLNGIDTTIYPGATDSINITDCSSWNLSAVPDPVTEGNSIVVSLATTGVSDGTYAFSITGVQSGDIQETGGVTWDAANSKYIGNFNLSNNASSVTLNILDDSSADGPETLTLSLDNGKDSVNVTVNDPAAPVSCGSQIAAWSNGQSNSTTTDGTTNSITVGNYGIKGFDNGGTIHLPELGGGFTAGLFYCQNPATGSIGRITYPAPPLTNDFYYEYNGVCYKGTFNNTTSSSNPQILTIV